MKARPWIVAACLSSVLWAPLPAEAQGKPGAAAKPADPAAEAKKKALPYLNGGNRAAAAGQWDDAYAELSIAWKLFPDWETAGSLGRAAYRTKHFAEAVHRLSFYLREAPANRVTAKQRADVEFWLRDARTKTGTLAITAPDGTDVLIDGEVHGRAPFAEPVHVDPGKHTIEARPAAAPAETKTIEIAAGQSVDVTFTVAAPTTGPAPPPKPVEPPSDLPRTLVLVGGSALALGGIAAGGASLGIAADKGAQKQQAAQDHVGRDAAQGFAAAEAEARNAALWSFVGGGLAAAGTAVFYFTTRSSAKAPVKGTAFVTPSGPGIWIEGSF